MPKGQSWFLAQKQQTHYHLLLEAKQDINLGLHTVNPGKKEDRFATATLTLAA
jgi:hypothetical protein